MSSRFLSGALIPGLDDGSADLNINSAVIQTLQPNLPVKTDAGKGLIATILSISDVNQLQYNLNNKNTLQFVKQSDPQAPAEAGTIKIYSKDNGTMYQIDEFGVEKALGGSGGSATNYKFSTSITPPPASGFCQFNSITPANVTAIHLNKTNSEGVDISPILATLRQGDQLLFSNAAKTNLKLYTISQETDNLTYVTLTVTLENQSNVANYTNNEEVNVGFLIQNPFNQSLNTTDAVTFNQLSITGNVQTNINMANNYVNNTNGVSVNLQAAETPADAGKLKIYANNTDNTLRVVDELGNEQFCSSDQRLNTTDPVTFNSLYVTSFVGTDFDMKDNYIKNTNGVTINKQAGETAAAVDELKIYANNTDNTLRVIDELGTEQFCSSDQRLYTADAPTFSGLNISAGGTGVDMNSNELIDANGLALNKLTTVTNAPPNELKIYADNADDHIKAVNQTGGVVYLSSDQPVNSTSNVVFESIAVTSAPSQIAYTPVATGLTATTLQTAIDESYNTLTSQIAPISSQINTGVDPANPMLISGAVSIAGASSINNLEAGGTVVWAACAQGIGNYLVTGLGELSGGGYLGLTGNGFNYMEGSIPERCYISNSGGALYCIEVQNYTTLVELSSLNTRPHYGGLSMMPDLNSMWVAANTDGFLRVNTSTPVLSELGQYPIPVGVSAPLNLKVYANGTRLAVGSINGVYIMNINNPSNPTLISNEALVAGDVTDMAVDEVNNWLIIATTNAANNIYVFDISNEASITQLYVFDNGNAPNHLSYDQPSQCLFVASGGQDTKIYAWDGVSLTLKNTLAPETSTTAAIIGQMNVGTYLFTAHGNSGAYSYSFQAGVIISDLTATTLTSDSITSNTIQVGELTSDMTTITQTTTPATNPAAGYNKLYTKADDKLYLLNSAGVETSVTPVAATPTLQQVYDASTPPKIDTATGAFTLQNGSLSNNDPVFEVYDGAGTNVVFSVHGNGLKQWSRYGVLVNNFNGNILDSNLTCPYSSGTNLSSTGIRNTMYGHYAGETCVVGDNNTFMGWESGKLTTSGSNTFVGAQSGRDCGLCSDNVAVGVAALYGGVSGATGSRNTAVGNQSLIAVTSGLYNTALGYLAGNVISTGSKNTYLGAQSRADAGSTNAQYRVGIGYNATADVDKGVVIGSSVVGEHIEVVKPGTTGDCDLGSSSKKFKNIYLSESVRLGTDVQISGAGTTLFINATGGVVVRDLSLTANGGGKLFDSGGEEVDFVYTDVRADVSSDCTYAGINTGNRGVATSGANTAFGSNCLTSIVTGALRNSVFGTVSGRQITTGSYNTIVGYNNGGVTDGNSNVMIGSDLTMSTNAVGRISIGRGISNVNDNHCVIKSECIRVTANNTCDLGSSTVAYKDAYLAGSLYTDTITPISSGGQVLVLPSFDPSYNVPNGFAVTSVNYQDDTAIAIDGTTAYLWGLTKYFYPAGTSFTIDSVFNSVGKNSAIGITNGLGLANTSGWGFGPVRNTFFVQSDTSFTRWGVYNSNNAAFVSGDSQNGDNVRIVYNATTGSLVITRVRGSLVLLSTTIPQDNYYIISGDANGISTPGNDADVSLLNTSTLMPGPFATAQVTVSGGLNVTGEVGQTAKPITSVATSSYTITEDDCVILVNHAGAVSLTLPLLTSLTRTSVFYTIKDTSGAASTNNIIISRAGIDTIDGATTRVVNTNYGSVDLVGTSAGWFVI